MILTAALRGGGFVMERKIIWIFKGFA